MVSMQVLIYVMIGVISFMVVVLGLIAYKMVFVYKNKFRLKYFAGNRFLVKDRRFKIETDKSDGSVWWKVMGMNMRFPPAPAEAVDIVEVLLGFGTALCVEGYLTTEGDVVYASERSKDEDIQGIVAGLAEGARYHLFTDKGRKTSAFIYASDPNKTVHSKSPLTNRQRALYRDQLAKSKKERGIDWQVWLPAGVAIVVLIFELLFGYLHYETSVQADRDAQAFQLQMLDKEAEIARIQADTTNQVQRLENQLNSVASGGGGTPPN